MGRGINSVEAFAGAAILLGACTEATQPTVNIAFIDPASPIYGPTLEKAPLTKITFDRTALKRFEIHILEPELKAVAEACDIVRGGRPMLFKFIDGSAPIEDDEDSNQKPIEINVSEIERYVRDSLSPKDRRSENLVKYMLSVQLSSSVQEMLCSAGALKNFPVSIPEDKTQIDHNLEKASRASDAYYKRLLANEEFPFIFVQTIAPIDPRG